MGKSSGLLFMHSIRKINLIGFIFILLIIILGFNRIIFAVEQNREATPSKPIEELLNEHTDNFMSIPGVVGTAQGLCNNRPCIKVFVIEKTKEIDQKIPDELDGYPVDVEETGEFKALPEE